MMHYLKCEPPRKWQAGTVGGKPFYFSCADCGRPDAEIAGIIANQQEYEAKGFAAIGLLGDFDMRKTPGLRPAIFCTECLEVRLAGQPPRPWNPPPAQSWPDLRHHNLSKCARWRVMTSVRSWETGAAHWRSWDEWAEALKRRLTRTLMNHLAAGGSVIEANKTEWYLGDGKWIPERDWNATLKAEHIANRVLGFGWSVALKPKTA